MESTENQITNERIPSEPRDGARGDYRRPSSEQFSDEPRDGARGDYKRPSSEQFSDEPRDGARGDYRRMQRRGPNKPYFKKRFDKINAYKLVIDYKRPDVLRRFVTEKGKILPRRITGTSAKNQRHLVREVKKARFLALLPMG